MNVMNFFKKQIISLYCKMDSCFRRNDGVQIKVHATTPSSVYIGNGRVLVKTIFNTKLIMNANNTDIAPTLILNKVWEPNVSLLIKKILPNSANVLELGANIGYFTTLMANLTSGKIFAFEANPRTFEYLEHNIQISGNLFSIKAYNKAAYDSNSQIEFYAVENNQGCSSVAYNQILEEFKDTQDKIIIDAVKIDDQNLGEINFIKMDIEGCEIKAIHGMQQTILKYKPIIVTEINKSKLDDVEQAHNQDQLLFNLLWEMGYKSYLIGEKLSPILNVHELPNKSDYDVLFICEK